MRPTTLAKTCLAARQPSHRMHRKSICCRSTMHINSSRPHCRPSATACPTGELIPMRIERVLIHVKPSNGYTRRAKSPLPTIGMYEAALKEPLTMLPLTEFPQLNASGGYEATYRPDSANGGGSMSSCFSPMPTRDHQQELEEETASIINQVRQHTCNIRFVAMLCIRIIMYYEIGIPLRCCSA